MYRIKRPQGFVLLIALIVATIFLTLGSGVLSLAIREFNLARISVESLGAFGVANMGVDCAFHHDVSRLPHSPYPSKLIAPDPNSLPTTYTDGMGNIRITCNGQPLDLIDPISGDPIAGTGNVEYVQPSPGITEYYKVGIETLYLDPSDTDGPCVDVVVRKIWDGGAEATEIEARGLNRCTAGVRRVERALCLRWESAEFDDAGFGGSRQSFCGA